MSPPRPPDFASITDADTKAAFISCRPEVVRWLAPGTKLFKWTKTLFNPKGISPWWQFLEATRLTTGNTCPGIREMQEYASRLGIHDRDYSRTRFAVTKNWNEMTNAVAIELVKGAWGYIGKAAGQRVHNDDPGVFFVGGEYQVWVPGLLATEIRQIPLLPYQNPKAKFGAR